MYNKKPKQKKNYQIQDQFKFEPEENVRKRQRQMTKSEKIISQQLSESLKSESFNSSMLANLSIETILSSREDVELDIEFSKAGERIRKKKLSQFIKETSELKSLDENLPLFELSKSQRINVLTGRTLLCIIYCALNICRSQIQLSDLLRFVIEGRISYYNTKLHLPEEITELDIPLSHEEHHSYRLVSYESIRNQLVYFVQLIPDLASSFVKPNLLKLCGRYLKEMCLPEDLELYVGRLLNFIPPRMIFNDRVEMVPNYEGRAMAYILFVLKLLFGLDGEREREMSVSAQNINKILKKSDSQLFVFTDWMNYIEYRQEILSKFYYPTMFNHDVKSEKAYSAFTSMITYLNQKTKHTEGSKVLGKDKKRMASKLNAQEILARLSKNHENFEPMGQILFPYTTTPLADNFKLILETSNDINRELANQDFTVSSCEHFLRPQSLVEELAATGRELKVVKSSFPKSYVFYKHREQFESYNIKKFHEVEENALTEKEWREDIRSRQKNEKKWKAKDAVSNHSKTYQRVLEKRNIWRKLITEKKSLLLNTTELHADEPQTYYEQSILGNTQESDSEVDDEDEIKVHTMAAQIEDILRSSERNNGDELTFVVPDFNLWHKMLRIKEHLPNLSEEDIEALPKSFLWLLNFSASILHQKPVTL